MPLSEKRLISRIRNSVVQDRRVITGIGDDCAVLRLSPGHEALLTTDFSIEGVHFRRDWQPAEVIGWRCLTRGLSDIAAMGGTPIAAFLSLALPARTPQGWVDQFFDGLLALATKMKVTLAGGDTGESPSRVLADIIVLGSVPAGRAVRRSTASVGDVIYVTGRLGGAAATLELLLRGKKATPRNFPEYFRPLPRVAVGKHLRERRWATSMIDISDGLSTDLGHICEEGGVGAEIHADAIPRAQIGRTATIVCMEHALHGGDDYELLFTVSPKTQLPRVIAGVPITRIGEIIRGERVLIIDSDGRRRNLKPGGWQHFSR
ncbi:MAG TPA: thiamine-phosphate kinase [Terriglobales bacterium]|jgi:thiamine-monophosphate kinase